MSQVITITQDHLDFLKKSKVFLNNSGDFNNAWLKIGHQHAIVKSILEPYSACYCGPNFSSIGSFTYTKSAFHPSVKIGRYCSIAAKVLLIPQNHPLDRLSTSGFDYSNACHFLSFENDNNCQIKKQK